MTTNFDCTLNGIALSSLFDQIYVTDVIEDAPRMHESILPLHSGGQQVLTRQRQSISIRVRFTILEALPPLRSFILQQIQQWALQSGYLTISARPGQQLHVSCTGVPTLSTDDWTEVLTLTFTSTRVPYWEDAVVTTGKGTGAVNLTVPGIAPVTPVEAVLLNTSASTIREVTVNCGSSHITFQGIAMASGGQLVISQVDGNFVATLDGASILHHRTMDSADELLVPCGQSVTMSIAASQPIYAFYHVRGRYL